MKKPKRRVRDLRAVQASNLALRKLAGGPRLRRVLDFIGSFLGLENLLQGVTLIAVGLLVIFAGAFTQTVMGVLLMVYGGYLLVGGRL